MIEGILLRWLNDTYCVMYESWQTNPSERRMKFAECMRKQIAPLISELIENRERHLIMIKRCLIERITFHTRVGMQAIKNVDFLGSRIQISGRPKNHSEQALHLEPRINH